MTGGPESERAELISKGRAERRAERELRLIRSCDAANASDDVRLIERELDALPDTVLDA